MVNKKKLKSSMKPHTGNDWLMVSTSPPHAGTYIFARKKGTTGPWFRPEWVEVEEINSQRAISLTKGDFLEIEKLLSEASGRPLDEFAGGAWGCFENA